MGFLHAVLLMRIGSQERWLHLKSYDTLSIKTLLGDYLYICFQISLCYFNMQPLSLSSFPPTLPPSPLHSSFLLVTQYVVGSFNLETYIFLQSWEIWNLSLPIFPSIFLWSLLGTLFAICPNFCTCAFVSLSFYTPQEGDPQFCLAEKSFYSLVFWRVHQSTI